MPLVRLFSAMIKRPEEWVSVADLVAATGVNRVTVYRRFGDLVSVDVLLAKRIADHRHFKLKAGWGSTKLGAKLRDRATSAGLI